MLKKNKKNIAKKEIIKSWYFYTISITQFYDNKTPIQISMNKQNKAHMYFEFFHMYNNVYLLWQIS